MSFRTRGFLFALALLALFALPALFEAALPRAEPGATAGMPPVAGTRCTPAADRPSAEESAP